MDESAFASHQLEITVDHNQIFLEDGDCEWGPDDLTLLYDKGAFARHLGAARGRVSIFTAKWYGIVRLQVVLQPNEPDDDVSTWDNVAEASLEKQSGHLVAYGPESYPDGIRMPVPCDTYRVRVYAGGIESVDEYMQKGQDHYRAVLCPAPYAAPALLHAGNAYPW